MPTALISVWDKTGIADFANRLAAVGVRIISTGGSARSLRDSGIDVVDVADLTGFPEILDGRVKTLHPVVHAGLLARRDRAEHMETLAAHGIDAIDVLVSNLYPFERVVTTQGVDDEQAIEHIDIGGPAMVRAAAKNHASVIVLVDPADYDAVATMIEHGGIAGVDVAERRRLAAKAFAHVAVYDSLVCAYLRGENPLPQELPVGARRLHALRYGENPHQRAAVYEVLSPGPRRGVATWVVHGGKELSYNNYLDASSAWGCALSFDTPTVVIVKHTLPCGVGSHTDLAEAYRRALAGDPISAFGGIVAANRQVDESVVDAIGRQRFDLIIAPGYSDAALERLLARGHVRVISAPDAEIDGGIELRSVPGGLLVQEPDRIISDPSTWECRTARRPTPEELATLDFAWRTVRWVKSNAIVLARPGMVVGVGAGQPNRVESVRIAARVAGERAVGSCLASDAFFPFPDGIHAAADAGVTAIVQPGGSVRDAECIAAADERGLAMVFTGTRLFRH